MNSLYSFLKRQNTSVKTHWRLSREIDDQIRELEQKKRDLPYPHLSDWLKKLGKRLMPHFKGAHRVDVLGPFGMTNETSLYIMGKPTAKDKEGKILGAITFAKCGDGYGIKNHETQTVMEPNKKHTITWMVRYMRREKLIS